MPYRLTAEEFEALPVPAIYRERREAIREMAAALFAVNADGLGVEKVTQAHPMARVREHFSRGIYTRTIVLPVGLRVIGMRHRQESINVVSCGNCTLMTEFGREMIEGPCEFVSPAGTQRFIWVHEAMVWTTIHRTDKTTSEEAFADIFIDETPMLAGRIQRLRVAA